MNIVLGSSSPRRLAVLKTAAPEGAQIKVVHPNIDERAIGRRTVSGEGTLTQLIAMAKNRAVRRNHPDAVIVTADTVTTCNNEVREKPADERQVRRWLASYAKHAIRVTTSVVVTRGDVSDARAWSDAYEAVWTDGAVVRFAPFTDEEIDRIVADGSVMGAAGAFIIEHPLFTDKVLNLEGDPETVQGLPGRIVRKLLLEAGRR